MSESHSNGSGSYRIKLSKSDNWMPWKQRMLAILRNQGLEKYIEKTAELPKPRQPEEPMTEEMEAINKWKEGDAKARTRLELSIRDSEMIHFSGAVMAHDMWNQLSLVKESWGHLGVLAMCQALYQATAKEGFDMVEHISKLRGLQNKLHAMENLVTDEDFVMILITSIPEYWDNYTESFSGSSGNTPTVFSHILIAILLDEDQRRKAWSREGSMALLSKGKDKQGINKDKECSNCKKKGHTAADCWAKGGGKEGQGAKGRKKRNQALMMSATQPEILGKLLNMTGYSILTLPPTSVPYERHLPNFILLRKY